MRERGRNRKGGRIWGEEGTEGPLKSVKSKSRKVASRHLGEQLDGYWVG